MSVGPRGSGRRAATRASPLRPRHRESPVRGRPGRWQVRPRHRESTCIGRPGRWQAGSVTLIAVALTVLVMCAGLMALDVGLLVVARARTQAAADLAALGALTPGGGPGASHGRPSVPVGPVGGGEPAARAGAVAAANGAELVACACGPTEAVVTVRSRVRLLPGGMVLSMTARARAVLPGLDGPEPSRRGAATPQHGPVPGEPLSPRCRGTCASVRERLFAPAPAAPAALPATVRHSRRAETKRAGPVRVPLVVWPGRRRVGSGRPSRVALDAGQTPPWRRPGWGQAPPLQYASSMRRAKP
jgi:hypothetical protein